MAIQIINNFIFGRDTDSRWLQCAVFSIFLLLLWSLLLIVFYTPILGTKQCNKDDVVVDDSMPSNELSKLIEQLVNKSIDPCNDFYEYVCGNYIKNSIKNIASIMEDLKERLKDHLRELLESRGPLGSQAITASRSFYQKCVAIDDDPYYRNISGKFIWKKIKDYGHFPVVDGDCSTCTPFDLTNLLTYFNRNRTVLQWILPGLRRDELNASRYILSFARNSDEKFTFARALQSLVRQRRTRELKPFFNFYRTVALLLMEDELGTSPHMDASATNKLNNDLKEMLVFERGIYQVPFPVDDEGNDKSPTKKRLPLSKVDRALKAVNWTRYLLTVAPEDVHGYIIDDPLVEVPDMNFLKTIDSILSDTPSRVLINYVVLRYVVSWSEALDSRYRNALKDLLRAINSEQELSERKHYCLSTVTNVFNEPVDALYERSRNSKEMKKSVSEIVDDVRGALKTSIVDNKRMTETLKKELAKKVDFMQREVAFHDEFTNTYLDNKFRGMLPFANLAFLEYADSIGGWMKKKRFRKLLDVAKSRRNSPFSSLEANVFYILSLNRISVPASFLQFPLYEPGLPSAYSYGSVGFAVAREIMHGFDSDGLNFDFEGKPTTGLLSQTQQALNETADCLIDKFDGTTEPNTKMPLNGTLTLLENLADFEGLKFAFQAYQHWSGRKCNSTRLRGLEGINEDQLFFIGAAVHFCSKYSPEVTKQKIMTDDRSPDRYRVNYAMQNLPEFSEVFKCRSGSAMNPKTRCPLWL